MRLVHTSFLRHSAHRNAESLRALAASRETNLLFAPREDAKTRRLVVFSLALLGMVFSAEAQACSALVIGSMQKRSDAIAWGTYSEGSKRGQGTLTVKRRVKGTTPKVIEIRWNPDFEDDGVNCPEWQPVWMKQKGRFYLADNRDGTFSVMGQAKLKKVRTD